MSPQFKGETPETLPPFLGAEFWKAGVKIAGVVVYDFDTENGPAYAVELVKPVEVKGEECKLVSLGNLKGFRGALAMARIKALLPGDRVHLACVGETDTGKGSPMLRFAIEVTRGE